jgi:hypothetical protein
MVKDDGAKDLHDITRLEQRLDCYCSKGAISVMATSRIWQSCAGWGQFALRRRGNRCAKVPASKVTAESCKGSAKPYRESRLVATSPRAAGITA